MTTACRLGEFAPGLAAMLVLGGALVGPARSEATESRLVHHGDWLAGCDTHARCVAIGVPGMAAPGPMSGVAIRIADDASAQSGFTIELIPVGLRPAMPADLLVGPPSDALALRGGRRMLDAERATRWLHVLAQGAPIGFRGPGADSWAAPSAVGFMEAWRALARARAASTAEAPRHGASPDAGRRRLARATEVMASGHPPTQILRFECPDGGRGEELRRFAWREGPCGPHSPRPAGRRWWARSCRDPRARGQRVRLRLRRAQGMGASRRP
jgi:hypothetical protein